MQFVIDAKDAVLSIDGKVTDYEKPVKLTYGSHTITVSTDSLDHDSMEAGIICQLGEIDNCYQSRG